MDQGITLTYPRAAWRRICEALAHGCDDSGVPDFVWKRVPPGPDDAPASLHGLIPALADLITQAAREAGIPTEDAAA
jgi:hypothetical protein